MRFFRPAAPARPSNTRPASPRAEDEAWLKDEDTWLTPLPVPEVHEGGESMWDQWHEAARELEEAFAPTQPSEQAPLSTAQPRPEPAPEPGRLSTDGMMLIARRNNRVCPRPAAWNDLYRLLEGERYVDLQPPPAEKWMWNTLSDLQKRLRFRDTIEWAERHGKLDIVGQFMLDLPEDDWLHMD